MFESDVMPGRRLRALAVASSATLLALVSLVSPLQAQTARWMQLGPPPAFGAGVAHDAPGRRFLVLDARSLWSVSEDVRPEWKQLETGLVPLFPRTALILDAPRNRLIGFQPASGTASFPVPAAVWQLDLNTLPLRWHMLSTAGAVPTTRYLTASAIFDPIRQRMVVYANGQPGPDEAVGIFTLSLQGTPTWSDLIPSGTAPTGRRYAQVAYDPFRDRMLVYGGFVYAGNAFDETWALTLSGVPTWTFLTPRDRVAYARYDQAMVIDSVGQRMMVSCGFGPNILSGSIYNDTWALDLSSSAPADSAVWTPLADGPSEARPTARERPSAWCDPTNHRMMLFGGFEPYAPAQGYRSDQWSLELAATPAWSSVGPDTALVPFRYDAVSVLDAPGDRLIMALGRSFASGVAYVGDTWYRSIESNQGWSNTTASGPTDRALSVGVVDATANRALVFGGEWKPDFDPVVQTDELWALDLAGPAWSALTPGTRPHERAETMGVFDVLRRQMLIHGGRYSSPVGHPTVLADTWRYDAAANVWSALAAGSYGGRWGEAGIVDPVRDRIVIFGGRDSASVFSDVHALSLSGGGMWSAIVTSGTPPPVLYNDGCRAAYDATGDRMIVVAREDTTLGVYALSLNAPCTWSRLAPNGQWPSSRSGFSAVFDPAGRRVLVSGGDVNGASDETWSLYLDESTPTQLSLMSSDVNVDRVRLAWMSDEHRAFIATAYRRAAGASWESRATLTPDGEGQLTFEDRNVEPGARYDYRLGVAEGGTERFYGAISVLIPRASGFRLEGARPNPSAGVLTVAFALPDDAPATLELLDVSGRRIAGRAVGMLGPGEHTLRLAERGVVPAGLYFTRLTRGGQVIVAKTVVVR